MLTVCKNYVYRNFAKNVAWSRFSKGRTIVVVNEARTTNVAAKVVHWTK